jgi:hypothetical protein
MKTNQRGIAIITVVLILLLLTVLGLTASMMMTQEDTTSSRMDLQRAAMYVAEAGLRRGERELGNYPYSNLTLTQFLSHVAVAETAATLPKIPQQPANKRDYTITKLGTYLTTAPGGGTELANQRLTPLGEGETDPYRGRQAFYSLYVRNNPEDWDPLNPSATQNQDTKIRIVSVGWISQDGRPIAVKILEEEFNWTGVNQNPSAQKQTNQGGTGSGMYGG